MPYEREGSQERDRWIWLWKIINAMGVERTRNVGEEMVCFEAYCGGGQGPALIDR